MIIASTKKKDFFSKFKEVDVCIGYPKPCITLA